MDHSFFGDWMPRSKKKNMSQGALDYCNGKALNSTPENTEGLIQDFQDKKMALKEMEEMMDPEDLKIMSQAMGMGNADPSNSVASRFKEAMKNMNK